MKKQVVVFILFFLFFLFYNLIVSPLVMDEVWVFGYANNLYLGLVPYRDFNIIISPLFFFLMSLPFYLFGNNMLVFHIENALLITGFLYIVYKVIGNKMFLLVPFLIFPSNSTFPNYNFFLLFLFVVLIYLEKENKSDLLIGIVLGLMILTKHTVGICILLPTFYYLKQKKKILMRFCGCLIPCFIFMIYLLITHTFSTFIDLGVLGLFDFGSNNQHFFNIFFFLVCLLLMIVFYHIYRKKELLFLFYLLAFVSITIPMFDYYHVWLYVIAFVFILLVIYSPKVKWLYLLSITFFVVTFIYSFIQSDFSFDYYPNHMNHFEYRYLDKNILKNLEKYNDIIKENQYKFFIVGNDGYFHKIILDQKATYLEMPLGGNFGYHGYQKMLKMVQKLDPDTLIFVSKSEVKGNTQIYENLFDYIKENYELVDEDDYYYFYLLKT